MRLKMKDCKECDFFEGYDYSDGTPRCSYSENGCNGYEYCPYNDSTTVIKDGIKIEIDAGFMHDYILHTLKNTIESTACTIACKEVKSIINGDIRNKVIAEVENQTKSLVEEEIKNFMAKDITIGGGWREPERTITRQQYLAETIEKELDSKFKHDALKSYAEKEVEGAIRTFERKLKDQINESINRCFNEATRQTLTDNVVAMLMCNDTYKRLSESMQSFLPDKT